MRGLRITGGSGRVLTREDITPCLEQLRERLVGKNVAMSIADRVCSNVADRLVGTSLGTFERIYPRVRASLEEVCSRILVSGRRVDVLRDALDARTQGRPYSIVFCGVNGVGKSTNLAKVCHLTKLSNVIINKSPTEYRFVHSALGHSFCIDQLYHPRV